ncbi:MAG: serine protease [Clostridia bacterium]|nr:serine protease [Clostridia bacterium]
MLKKTVLCFLGMLCVLCSFVSCNDEVSEEHGSPRDDFKNMLSSVVAVEFKVEKNGVYEKIADGSGVVIKVEDGDYVLTCRHVIYDAENRSSEIRLTSYMNEDDGGEVAECIWLSESYDLALLKCDTLTHKYPELKPIEPSRELYAGQRANAVGNLDGNGLCLTSGSVTREYKRVTLPVPYGTSIDLDLIEYDALTGRGYSGGGLFDESGKLLGIINARNTSAGTGWAIPAELAIALADEAISKGLTDTVDLGIEVGQANSLITTTPSIKATGVLTGSVASAFLKDGDQITSVEINGERVATNTPIDLEVLLISADQGDTLTFNYISEKAEKGYTFTINEIHLKGIN